MPVDGDVRNLSDTANKAVGKRGAPAGRAKLLLWGQAVKDPAFLRDLQEVAWDFAAIDSEENSAA